MERQPTEREKLFASRVSAKGFLFQTGRELIPLNNEQQQQTVAKHRRTPRPSVRRPGCVRHGQSQARCEGGRERWLLTAGGWTCCSSKRAKTLTSSCAINSLQGPLTSLLSESEIEIKQEMCRREKLELGQKQKYKRKREKENTPGVSRTPA